MKPAAFAIVLTTVALTAGCTASITSTTVKTTGSITTAIGSSAPAAKAAHTGTTITLDDTASTTDAEHLAITLIKINAHPKAIDAYSAPAAGKRYYAVQFRLVNTSKAAFSDTPGNGAKALDSQGQQFEAGPDDTAAGPSFPSSTTLAPGASALGWVTFQVPVTAVITGVQYALDSGFGPVGEWSIP